MLPAKSHPEGEVGVSLVLPPMEEETAQNLLVTSEGTVSEGKVGIDQYSFLKGT